MTRFTGGNRIDLLHCGAEYFPALLAAIDGAEREIFLESYIFADDETGRNVAAALEHAARRGCAVRVLVDGFGARHFPQTFGPSLQQAGAQYLIYRAEIAPFILRRYRLRRLHRKLVAIDGKIAFIGGINIIADDNTPPGIGPSLDYAVRIEGPLLAPILSTMRRAWETVAWVSFKRHYRLPDDRPLQAQPAGNQRAAFLLRTSLRHRDNIANAYLEAILMAKESVLLANAYFLPGWRFRRALTAAARRGIRVTLLVQGKSDHALWHYAAQALYDKLTRVGVRVFEYRQGFLHAKVAVIDRQWATVGSSNIDPFSLFLAKESNIAVLDGHFARQLEDSLLTAIHEGATEHGVKPQTPLSRLLRWLCYGLVRLLADIAGYGHWHRPPGRSGKG
ncbi:MAG: cardiolipin synthase ClsB [Zoogloeaceae bacterium]|jgi:cardiolipin synthase|nr:cardiolipin synthase ClsB [Zoogloeaceae bacterium]